MQTFLPFSDFKKSAFCLDKKRLQCQIKEANQIINIIFRKMNLKRDGKKGWFNHPVLNIWSDESGKFYLKQLIDYTDTMWTVAYDYRNINNITWLKRRFKIIETYNKHKDKFGNPGKIEWSRKFHKTMKANLIRKDVEHYQKYFKNNKIQPQEGYLWEHCKLCLK
jgi:hypothetical protein